MLFPSGRPPEAARPSGEVGCQLRPHSPRGQSQPPGQSLLRSLYLISVWFPFLSPQKGAPSKMDTPYELLVVIIVLLQPTIRASNGSGHCCCLREPRQCQPRRAHLFGANCGRGGVCRPPIGAARCEGHPGWGGMLFVGPLVQWALAMNRKGIHRNLLMGVIPFLIPCLLHQQEIVLDTGTESQEGEGAVLRARRWRKHGQSHKGFRFAT